MYSGVKLSAAQVAEVLGDNKRDAGLPLFDAPPPYRAGHETQRAAAVAIAPRASALREKVFRAILAGHDAAGVHMAGCTNEEVHNATGLSLQTVCARCNELQHAGLVKDSGLRRAGKSGVLAKVWVARVV